MHVQWCLILLVVGSTSFNPNHTQASYLKLVCSIWLIVPLIYWTHFALTSQQVNYLDISIESKIQGSDDDAGSMYEGHTSDSYSSGGEDDNDDFVLEGKYIMYKLRMWDRLCMMSTPCLCIVSEGRKGKKKLDKIKDSLPPLLSRVNGVMHVSLVLVFYYWYIKHSYYNFCI